MTIPAPVVCHLTELDVTACAHCRGLDDRPASYRLPAERTRPALFDNRCPGCATRIHPGDLIGLVEGEWFCTRCYS